MQTWRTRIVCTHIGIYIYTHIQFILIYIYIYIKYVQNIYIHTYIYERVEIIELRRNRKSFLWSEREKKSRIMKIFYSGGGEAS